MAGLDVFTVHRVEFGHDTHSVMIQQEINWSQMLLYRKGQILLQE